MQLPLNNRGCSDQQHKEDRHQYRRYEPLTEIELAYVGHGTAFTGRGGSATLSVTDNSQGARGDIRDVAADWPNSEFNRRRRKRPAPPGRFTRSRRSTL